MGRDAQREGIDIHRAPRNQTQPVATEKPRLATYPSLSCPDSLDTTTIQPKVHNLSHFGQGFKIDRARACRSLKATLLVVMACHSSGFYYVDKTL